jgi:hypothetical protein
VSPAARRADRGHVAVEFLGAIPYLGLGLLATLQLTFAVSTVQAASTAARAGARAVSQGTGDATAAARAAVPSWLQQKIVVSVGGGAQPGVSVSAPMPLVFPGFSGPTVTRRAWFDAEHGVTPWG